MKKLSVIIVSYNVSAFLEKCLQSVYQAAEDMDIDIIVVDNHSVDDSVAMVKRKFPAVTLIENQQNLGYGKANNQALQIVNTKYALLLNPDTIVNEDTLKTCVAFMDAHPEAASTGVKMFDGSGNYLPESKRGFPSPFTAICKMTGLSSLFPKSRIFNAYYQGHLDPDITHAVDVLTGAFMFIRMEALRKVGGFDEDFFMYGEDIDLSYRFIKAGYKNYYLPTTSIIHYKGESTKKSSFNYVRSFYRAMLIFLDKHYALPRYRPLVWLIKIGIYLRAALSGVRRILRQSLPVLADALLFGIAILIIQYIWSNYYYKDPSHFDIHFFTVNLPLYTGCFLIFSFLAGVYDKYYSTRRLATGLLAGMIAILVIYAMLNQAYRSSRAVILLSGMLSFILALLLRFVVHKARYKTFRLNYKPAKRAILIASKPEAIRIMELLNRSAVRIDLLARLNPRNEPDPEFFDNTMQQLEEVLKVFQADELIFSAHDVPFQTITYWMNRLGNEYAFKIASAQSQQIVGSKSKSVAGELYTMDFEYRLARSYYRRNKRIFDVLSSLVLLVLSPLLLLFIHDRQHFIHACVDVLTGRKTWVGYHPLDVDRKSLPRIREGIFWPGAGVTGGRNAAQVAGMKNRMYAKEYSILKDMEIVISRIWKSGDGMNIKKD